MTVYALVFTAKPFLAPNGHLFDAAWGQIEFNEEETTETTAIGSGDRRIWLRFDQIASLALSQECPRSSQVWNAEGSEAVRLPEPAEAEPELSYAAVRA